MIIAEEKEIFNAIARHIVSSEVDDKWDSSILRIAVIDDTVDLNLTFFYRDSDSKNTKLNGAFKCSLEILRLHKLTNEHSSYKKWNRSEFTLFADSKFKIEYAWDQELHDEVNKLKRE